MSWRPLRRFAHPRCTLRLARSLPKRPKKVPKDAPWSPKAFQRLSKDPQGVPKDAPCPPQESFFSCSAPLGRSFGVAARCDNQKRFKSMCFTVWDDFSNAFCKSYFFCSLPLGCCDFRGQKGCILSLEIALFRSSNVGLTSKSIANSG